MEITNRKTALLLGLKSYFTGKPCKHGHLAARWIDGHCMVCHAKQAAATFQKTKDARKEKRIAGLQAWKARNPQKARGHHKNTETLRRRIKGGRLLAKKHSKEITKFYANCPPDFHVDHIVPLNGKTVSGLHVPWNLQYLPAHENIRKGNRHGEE